MREVLPDGDIETVAGDDSRAALPWMPPTSQGNPPIATLLSLDGPVSLAFGPNDVLWIALWNRNEVVEVDSHQLYAEALGSPPPGAPAWAKLPSPGCDPDSIAWSGGNLYVDCTHPFKLFSLSPNHVWTYLGVVRPHLSHSAFAEASHGVVYGLSQDKIIRVAGTTVRTFKTFDRIAGVGPFWPTGIAVAADGTIYLDQQGGGGVGPPAIISLSRAGHVTVIWAHPTTS